MCSIKMSKEIIAFGDIEIEKLKFHFSKYPIILKNVDVGKIMISINNDSEQGFFW